MPQYFSPFSGYSPAGDTPSYYNPYTALGGSQGQPGQQAGQGLVPGKDMPTPGSKHGAGKRIRVQHPVTGEVREVDASKAQLYMNKGGRII